MLSSMMMEKVEFFNASTVSLRNHTAKTFLIMHLVFVRLLLNCLAIAESGNASFTKSLRWSITENGRLCSAIKDAILISALFTSSYSESDVTISLIDRVHTTAASFSLCFFPSWCFCSSDKPAMRFLLQILQCGL